MTDLDAKTLRDIYDNQLRPEIPDPVPAGVTAALSSVVNTSSASKSRVIRTWLGTSKGENGKTRVTFVWEPMPRAPGLRQR